MLQAGQCVEARVPGGVSTLYESTYPVAPIACVVAVRFTVEVVHAALSAIGDCEVRLSQLSAEQQFGAGRRVPGRV